MSTSLLFYLLSVTLILVLTRRSRGAVIMTCLTWTIFWLVGSGIPAEAVLGRLQTAPAIERPEWRSRNVIILLGWDVVRWPDDHVTTGVLGSARVREAARLYFGCRTKAKVCRVLVSGGDPTGQGRPEAEAMAQSLTEIGVPRTDLILEPRSNNTFKNAEFSSALMQDQNFDHVILVTSGFHLTRSLLYFGHFVRSPMVGAPADHLRVRTGWIPNAANFMLFDLGLTEVAGLIRFRLYNQLGWNPPGVR